MTDKSKKYGFTIEELLGRGGLGEVYKVRDEIFERELALKTALTDKEKDIDFLNALIEVFLAKDLVKKNEEAMRIIRFIDKQLIGISDSLMITERRLQDFRSRNRIMDVSAQGQQIIDQAVKLEDEKARYYECC